MRYSQEIIEDLRGRCDIVDIISGHVALRQRGNRFWGLCPFHRERTPSFSVTPQTQMFHCFGCNAGGNVISFIMKIENFSFVDTLKHLAARVNFPLPEPVYGENYQKASAQRKIILEIYTAAAKFYYERLQSDNGAAARDYLEGRRISVKFQRKFGLGLSDSASLLNHLQNSFDMADIMASGLVRENERGGKSDRFRNRLMFPIFDIQGRVIAFGGRDMGNSKVKYINSEAGPIFDKSRVLYGLNLARKTNSPELILVEGYMDVIALHQAGFANACAAMGTAFNINHARVIKNYCKTVILLFDSDEAGERAISRAAPILESEGLRVKILRLEGAKDPDEFLINHGSKAFDKALSNSFDYTAYQIHLAQKPIDTNNPAERAAFAKTAATIIAKLPTAIERDAYAQNLAQISGLSEFSIREEIARQTAAPADLPKLAPMQVRPMDFAVSPGCDEARRGLLYLMAADSALCKKITPLISPSELENPDYIKIFEILVNIMSNDRHIAMADILGYTDNENTRNKMAQIFALDIDISRTDLNIILMDKIRIIKETYIDHEITGVGDDIRKLNELMTKKAELRSLYIT